MPPYPVLADADGARLSSRNPALARSTIQDGSSTLYWETEILPKQRALAASNRARLQRSKRFSPQHLADHRLCLCLMAHHIRLHTLVNASDSLLRLAHCATARVVSADAKDCARSAQ